MSLVPPQIGMLIAALKRGNVVHLAPMAQSRRWNIEGTDGAYDYLTTLYDEVVLVWNARWGTGKILYLASRYLIWPEIILVIYINLFDVNPRACHVIFAYSSCETTHFVTLRRSGIEQELAIGSALAGVTIAEVVLIMRTWAIWGAKSLILFVLAGLLLCITVRNCYLMSEFVRQAVFISVSAHVPSAHGCVLIETSRRIALAWLSISIFRTRALLIVCGAPRNFSADIAAVKLRSSSGLVSSLYRDGILYFVCLFGIVAPAAAHSVS
ncbi:hypothetical protein AURDEDRAFT_165009 [Auricularia subglabra TFB-10046 SS5]|nr:hypothetical protein AURDEDRAFT_165009 [Auricularia subglabra TFB-10046 SS5]